MISVLIKRWSHENTETKEKHIYMKAEIEVINKPTSQRMPRIASCHQKLGERHGTDSPSEFAEGTNPARTLILDF